MNARLALVALALATGVACGSTPKPTTPAAAPTTAPKPVPVPEDRQCPQLRTDRDSNLERARVLGDKYGLEEAARWTEWATKNVVLAHDLGCAWAANAIIRDGAVIGWRHP